ncbi:MAG TPA: nicotinate-nucleotide adenylyltransferase [Gemmatimonadaceae bacterium]|nr:nicotinate-nucleotide adenylyltransferase [Gemmatimonadaceae bacterium]
MRLGIFGGSFDPPHVGHLLAASDAFEFLELDRLVFVPAAVQPFKQHEVQASAAQRLRMVELMIADDPRFAADPVEIDRMGLSFTVDTLDVLAAREPGARRFLLIGEDLADEISTWRDARRIAELAEVVVLARTPSESGHAGDGERVPLTRIATRRIEISSTEIRARVLAGKTIHGFVTEAVAGFIEAAGLYRHRGTTC